MKIDNDMKNKTFSEYQYIRPNIQEVEKQFNDLNDAFIKASSYEDASSIVKQVFKISDDFETMSAIVSIRNSINTKDEFYEQEKQFFDENYPNFTNMLDKFYQNIFESKYREQLEEEFGKHLFALIELKLKSFDPKIIPLLQQENKLITEYTKLIASAEIEFVGKIHNLSQMSVYSEDLNRNIRKGAEEAVMKFFDEKQDEIDTIYDELVKLRTKMAHELGFESYIPLAYYQLCRSDYDAKDVENYRKQVYEDLVPLVTKLYEQKAKNLSIDDLKSYDLNLGFKTGNPTPKGNREWMVNNALKMYSAMSNETKEFFEFMVNHQLLDLDTLPNKESGGYCNYIPNYQSPFIFANFNGTSGDADVLTHEAGHAFQMYCGKDINVPLYRFPTLEACEVHSMSMEFLAYPWMELFFKEDTEKYIYSHILGTIDFIPYGVLVDEFQHRVYSEPNMTKEERKKVWRELEKKYLPYKKYDNELLEKGTFWYRQSHIFIAPFYYIDYTLAQVCAQQFWIKDQENHKEAWNDYYRLCKKAGSESFLKLLEVANIRNPFTSGTVKYVVSFLEQFLNKMNFQEIDKVRG